LKTEKFFLRHLAGVSLIVLELGEFLQRSACLVAGAFIVQVRLQSLDVRKTAVS
jgi:hypothetical protein